MSLRTRLVLGAAAAVAFAVILASALVYVLIGNDLQSQIDQTLQQNAQTAESKGLGPVVVLDPPNVFELTRDIPTIGYYQVVAADGTVYVPASYTDVHPLSVNPAIDSVVNGSRSHLYYGTVLLGAHTRVLAWHTEIVTTDSNTGFPTREGAAILVTASLTALDNEHSQLGLILILISIGGVALAAGAGLLVARSTLRPVRKLSETAERVRSTRDLSERISVVGSDEVGQLAHTFNEMLAALDEAATRQQRLVQDASHELRTPLTSLRTNIEVLANADGLPPEDRAQLLHDVVAQIGELTELVSELTELARGEEQEEPFEPVRLDLVAGDAVARIQRNRPDVPIDAALTPTTVVGSAANLERAIANLLDNAAKWSPPGEPVEIRLAGGELTVRDHGPGIAEADAPHVFERFYRATSARGMPGSGLGLAIVNRVAEAHGGSVAVEAAPGGGTLMRLRIAVDVEATASLGRDAATAADQSRGEGGGVPRWGPLAGRRAGPHAGPGEVRPGASRTGRSRILRRRNSS